MGHGGRSPGARPGLPGSVRAQAVGVLALAISVAVVIVVLFVMPRAASVAAGHRGAGRAHAGAARRQVRGRPTSPPTQTTVATSGMAVGAASPLGSGSGSLAGGRGEGGSTSSAYPVTPPASPSNVVGTMPPSVPATVGPSSGSPATTPVPTPTTTTPVTAGTTASPTTSPAHVATSDWPGNLEDPYVSAQYQVTTTGGMVSGTATWSGTPSLALTVACGGASKQLTGLSGLYVSVDAPAGPCTITLAEPSTVGTSVSYSLSADYPAA